jgi:hypothetical protein
MRYCEITHVANPNKIIGSISNYVELPSIEEIEKMDKQRVGTADPMNLIPMKISFYFCFAQQSCRLFMKIFGLVDELLSSY